MHSALYHGWLDHRRREPRPHAFRYGLFMAWLDLAELESVFRGRWLWSTSRPALARFHRGDHLGDPSRPLDAAVRALVAERTGRTPAGPIRLLTHLRFYGYVFNPVSFYYCFDADDQAPEFVVAEVNNTPWGERHAYVLVPERTGDWLEARSAKAMHVSPFHPMALDYHWRFRVPGDRLAVSMSLRPAGDAAVAGAPGGSAADAPAAPGAAPAPAAFDATMSLRRVPIRTASLARTLLRFPFMTGQVIAAIHWEALRLWLKRVPVHDHPLRRSAGERTAHAPSELPR